MQINSNYNSISFSSLKCPVKPFTIKTPKGALYCREIDYSKTYDTDFYRKIGQFFVDIFANTSAHPFWEKCRKQTLDKDVYEDYISSEIQGYKQYFKDPDTTVILARDKDNNMVAALYSRTLDLDAKLKDNETLYIDGLAVSSQYRGQNVGKTLLSKLLKASKDRFSDVFLVAYKESSCFYEKLNFKKMDKNDLRQKYAIKELSDYRIDYPEYADLMHKKLDKNLPDRWYDRVERNK